MRCKVADVLTVCCVLNMLKEQTLKGGKCTAGSLETSECDCPHLARSLCLSAHTVHNDYHHDDDDVCES